MPFDGVGFDNVGFTETKEIGTKRILKDAKARIGTPELWCKYKLVSGNKACALGAIGKAASSLLFSTPWLFSLMDIALAAQKLEQHIPAPFRNVPEYNNALTTTHADVMAWFDRAIASC